MKKALSLFLALCMVFTTFPVWVMAQEVDTITGLSEEIIGFSALAQTEKTVALGTSLKDLDLPATLTATVQAVHSVEEEARPDSGSVGEDPSTPDEALEEPADDAVSGDEDTPAPAGALEGPAEGSGISAHDTSSTAEQMAAASSPGEEADQPEETGKTTRTIAVTWASQPEYDANAEGEYLFTPVIEGYTVSAELPQIKVTVQFTPAPAALGMLLGSTGSILSIQVSTADELMAAIPDIATNGTIFLTDDITLTETVTINHSRSFTINLGGKTLDGGASTCIQHNGSGILTIQNGKITANTDTNKHTIELNSSSGGLRVIDATVENTSYGNGIVSWSAITIEGGTVKAAKNDAIEIKGQGGLNISGATIEGAVVWY
ncbi:MAG: hypothetical protein ACOX0K_01820 [Oscillospiraceae bacterium]